MSDVYILGELPTATAAALDAVGLQTGPQGTVAVGIWPPAHGPDGSSERLFVALVEDAGHAAEAIEAGAVATLLRPVSQPFVELK